MIPYIRVKRKNQTVFVDVQFSDTFASVKEKLGALFHMAPQHIQLWLGLNQVPTVSAVAVCTCAIKESKELTDVATLADHDLQNDSVIYMCWKKESALCIHLLSLSLYVSMHSDQWEELSVTKVEALDADSGVKAEA
ncbi:hypothetical protein FI667_g13950, partial [Globisporangium splendens]